MALYHKTGPISIGDALDVIIGFGEIDEHIEYAGRWRTIGELRRMFKEFNALEQPADSIRLMFWGGPPGMETWYKTTLRLFMLDKIFRSEAFQFEWELLTDFAQEILSEQRIEAAAQ